MSSTPTTPVPAREQWSGQLGFLMAAIGSAIGLGNIWRFPGVAYSNGGGAFMIPYIIALLAVGVPVLLLDYALGHRYRGSSPAVFRRVSARFEWLGWWHVVICFVIMTYYVVIVAWALRYTVFSLTIAWGEDAAGFFNEYIGLGTISEAGVPAYSARPIAGVVVPLVLVWAYGLYVVARGVSRGVERANRIFLPVLVVMFLMLVVRAMLLPGATDGLNTLFTPDWGKLGDYRVWMAAFGQIFFSLSIGFGIMLTYASYLKPKSNLTGTALVAGFANSSFEILAGIGVFSAIGFMAHQGGVSVSEVEGLTGPILSFVTFPKIISMMPGGPLFGVLFFSSLVLAGVTSLLSLLQVVSGGLQDKFGWSPARSALVLGVPATAISLVLFGTRSGLNNLDIVDNFINSVGVVSSAILFAVLCAVAGPRLGVLRAHINSVSSVKVPKLWEPLVGIVIPVVLFVMMAMSIVQVLKQGYESYPSSYVLIFGWGSVAVAVIASLIFTLIPWKHRPVDTHAAVVQILADDADDTASIEGGAK